MKIKTKEQVLKEIKDLTPKEISDGIIFQKIKRKNLNKEIDSCELSIIEKRGEIDFKLAQIETLELEVSNLRKEIASIQQDKFKLIKSCELRAEILKELKKVDPESRFKSVWQQFENEQLEILN